MKKVFRSLLCLSLGSVLVLGACSKDEDKAANKVSGNYKGDLTVSVVPTPFSDVEWSISPDGDNISIKTGEIDAGLGMPLQITLSGETVQGANGIVTFTIPTQTIQTAIGALQITSGNGLYTLASKSLVISATGTMSMPPLLVPFELSLTGEKQ